ncbi:carboxypeptidase B-like [Myzus persicae]|uniref:carboxypeptidase B-like n=1 Tax=Myzus persicae TaxID=13164 RepID=UPI000B938E6D|nr:carboxypeptidase B-like [Myzus persicae]
MDGCSRVLYCVFTLLALLTFTECSENSDQHQDVEEKITYNGDQVLRVETVNSKQRKKIKELENQGLIEKWFTNSTSVDIMVKKENSEIVKNTLNNGSLSFNIFINDIQRAINDENPPINEDELELFGRQGHNLTFERYHKVDDIYKYIDHLSQEYPDIVEIETIGKSHENVPLRVIRIKLDRNATDTKSIWIDGGIHAREWIAVSSVLYLINELVYNRDALESHMKNIEFHIIPILNPDGYKHSHEKERLWRKNRSKPSANSCVGADLNRNWDYHWGETGASKYSCAEIYRGVKASSERETQAVVKYIMKNPNKFKGFLTFHSYGQYILYPWGYAKRVPSDHTEVHRVGQVMATAIKKATSIEYTVGNSATLLYPAAGASDDWAKGVAKIKYAYTVELKDTGKYGFILPPSEIVSTGKEAFAAVSALANEIGSENNKNV